MYIMTITLTEDKASVNKSHGQTKANNVFTPWPSLLIHAGDITFVKWVKSLFSGLRTRKV